MLDAYDVGARAERGVAAAHSSHIIFNMSFHGCGLAPLATPAAGLRSWFPPVSPLSHGSAACPLRGLALFPRQAQFAAAAPRYTEPAGAAPRVRPRYRLNASPPFQLHPAYEHGTRARPAPFPPRLGCQPLTRPANLPASPTAHPYVRYRGAARPPAAGLTPSVFFIV